MCHLMYFLFSQVLLCDSYSMHIIIMFIYVNHSFILQELSCLAKLCCKINSVNNINIEHHKNNLE